MTRKAKHAQQSTEEQSVQDARLARKSGKKDQQADEMAKLTEPWISMRSGLIIIAIVSIGMGAWTAFQAIPIKGLVEGTLWGMAFGGSIWLVFALMLAFNRILRHFRSDS